MTERGKPCPNCGGIMCLFESSEMTPNGVYSMAVWACIFCGLRQEVYTVTPYNLWRR